jgi:hypothetical protein
MSGQSQDPANTDYGLGTGTGTGEIRHELGTSRLDTGGHGTDGLGTGTSTGLGTGTGGLGTGGLDTGELGTGGLCPWQAGSCSSILDQGTFSRIVCSLPEGK